MSFLSFIPTSNKILENTYSRCTQEKNSNYCGSNHRDSIVFYFTDDGVLHELSDETRLVRRIQNFNSFAHNSQVI